jgi:hypothetical protein
VALSGAQKTGLVIGAAVAVLLVSRKASAAVIGGSTASSPSNRDFDALANMIITETGFNHSKSEMAQIVWIAINRSKRQDKPIWFVVQPGRGPSPVWSTGVPYRIGFERAPQHPRWEEAREFVELVFNGAYPNLKKTAFVHPGGMPVPPCASNRVQTTTPYGERCLPPWDFDTVIGKAWFA